MTGQNSDSSSQESLVTEGTASEDPPFSHGFFDRDKETSKARAEWLKEVALGGFMIICIIWTVLPIYWGALAPRKHNIHNLSAWVVDFDGGDLGQAIIQKFQNVTGNDQLSWLIMPASRFPGGPSEVGQAVVNDQCWAAVVVNPGSTDKLNAAVSAADASYNGSSAVTVYANEARNEKAYEEDIMPNIVTPLNTATQKFNLQNAQQLGRQQDVANLLTNAPSTIVQPLYYTINNLRPFDVPVVSVVEFVGLIYLLILAFVIATQLLTAHTRTGFGRRLKLKHLIFVRICTPVTIYFFVSLMYSLLSEVFHVPFDRKFGRAGFVIYWMMAFCSMIALGLALEAMITLLTPVFTPWFLILLIITNVAVTSYPIEILPAFYRYGFAMPFYNVSRTVRTIIFGTKNQVGLNFGVQIAWICVSLITIPLIQWFVRRREIKEWKKQQRKD